jgi:hypothetical protein
LNGFTVARLLVVPITNEIFSSELSCAAAVPDATNEPTTPRMRTAAVNERIRLMCASLPYGALLGLRRGPPRRRSLLPV